MAQEANHDGGEPAMESAALVPGPPAATPPPWTDEGSLLLLEILRLHLRGVPHWIIPRYVITGVDFYDREPQELLRAHPSAASADGKTALYFLNGVRAKGKTGGRKCRMAPGGTWRSERAAVDVWGPSRIAGTRQNLSFIIKGPEGEDLRSGYIAQEFSLAGDQLVLTKMYFTPRGEEAVSQAKDRVLANARRKKTAAAAAAAASPEPARTPAPVAAAASSPAPRKRAAPSSSSPAPIDEQAASDSSAGRPTPSTRLLLLEVGDSPVSQGQDFWWRKIHGAAELVGSSMPLNKRKLLRFDSEGLFLFEDGAKKIFSWSP